MIDYIELAEFYKVFGDVTRIRILNALAEKEMKVGDISASLDMSQSAVSHQLNTLRKAKLVRQRREGKAVFYSLDDEHINAILSCGIEHIMEK